MHAKPVHMRITLSYLPGNEMLFSESPLNFYRTALNFGVDYNNVLVQGNLRIRRYQIEQIEAAMSDYSKLSEKLGENSKQEQLLNISLEVAGSQLERNLCYWNALTNVLGQNQIELAGVFQSRAVELLDGFRQQMDQIPSAVPLPVDAMFKNATEVAHSILSQQPHPQAVHSIFANGAQYAGRGKPGEHRGQPTQRQ